MRTITLALVGLVLAGCQSKAPQPTVAERARFFLESADGRGQVVTLPQSGSRITVVPKAILTEFDVVNVTIAHVELGDCLVFHFTPAASRDLDRLTAANLGRRLVLVLGGIAFGARRISHAMDHGTLFTYVEVPDEALPALAASLNETAAALHPPSK